jgi:hypothetical protein
VLREVEIVLLHQNEKFAFLVIQDDDFGGFRDAIDGSLDEQRNILRFLKFLEDHKLKLFQGNFISKVFFVVPESLSPLVRNVLGHLELSISHFSA